LHKSKKVIHTATLNKLSFAVQALAPLFASKGRGFKVQALINKSGTIFNKKIVLDK